MTKLTEVDWDAKITIENICVACERKIKPCKEPCKRWYDFVFPNRRKKQKRMCGRFVYRSVGG